MRVLKEMARNIADIPEERIYLQFVSPHHVEWCARRVESWDERFKVLKMPEGWRVYTSKVDEDTVAFRIADNWGERRGKFVDGILHRQAEGKTLVLVVDAMSKPTACFTKALLVVTVISLVAIIDYTILMGFGAAAGLCTLFTTVVALPFVYMWVYPALSKEGFVANSPVIERIRKSLGDTEYLLKV